MSNKELIVLLMIVNINKRLVQQKVLRKLMNAFEVSACDVDSVHWRTRIERTPIVSNGPELFQLNTKTNVFKTSSSKHLCRCWNRLCVLSVILEHSSVRWTNTMWIKFPIKQDSPAILIYSELFQAREVSHTVVQYNFLDLSQSLSFQIRSQMQRTTAYQTWFCTRRDAVPREKSATYVINATLHWLRIKCRLFPYRTKHGLVTCRQCFSSLRSPRRNCEYRFWLLQ